MAISIINITQLFTNGTYGSFEVALLILENSITRSNFKKIVIVNDEKHESSKKIKYF